MINPFGLMYLRPGNLWTDFRINRKKVSNVKGHPVQTFEDHGMLTGILSEASQNDSDMTMHRWDQDQHSLTHTLILRGTSDLKKGDYLTSDNRVFLVLLHDNIGNLGASEIVYLEERNDLK